MPVVYPITLRHNSLRLAESHIVLLGYWKWTPNFPPKRG